MAITELSCGCKRLNQACVISPTCRAQPPHTSQNPPGGGSVGPAVSSPAKDRQRAGKAGGGRRLKPGRYRMDPIEGGEVVRVEDENDA